MFLSLTADHRLWKESEKTLFLGGWCRMYSKKHIWSGMDYEILPYHWDDRQRLYRDFKYLEGVYEKYLLRRMAKAFIPESILNAPKRPLHTPQREWLANELSGFVDDIIQSRKFRELGWFDLKAEMSSSTSFNAFRLGSPLLFSGVPTAMI